MTIFVADRDFTLHLGDVREILPRLDAGSVDCVVTSPPYWGLRDYGTGGWDGGDPDCGHAPTRGIQGQSEASRRADRTFTGLVPQGRTCSRCGATRVDTQLGLEATPDLYVAEMVQVFRQVRRVLAPHGTCWVNLGDSYAQGPSGTRTWEGGQQGGETSWRMERRWSTVGGDLKPKDLVGIPWRVAFALQADGWYLRSDIVWSKPNPMPESVTDRPTKSHEYVFLLSKGPRYFFDQEAVREGVTGNAHARGNGVNPKALVNQPGEGVKQNASFPGAINELVSSRNVRSVWEIATQPYPEAHFATFPEALPERCIKAGCPEQVCETCGKPRERLTQKEGESSWERHVRLTGETWRDRQDYYRTQGKAPDPNTGKNTPGTLVPTPRSTLGWSDCGHGRYRPGVVLDPFMGSGTVALVARRLGRRSIGVELSPEYAALAARRLQQLSLLAEEQYR